MFPIVYLPQIRQTVERSANASAPVVPVTRNLRALVAMLMAVALAVLAVAADQLVDIWEDNHLLLGWVAACALVAGGVYLALPSLRRSYQTWSAGRAEARSFAQFMAMASVDPRLMAEYQAARLRAEQEAEAL